LPLKALTEYFLPSLKPACPAAFLTAVKFSLLTSKLSPTSISLNGYLVAPILPGMGMFLSIFICVTIVKLRYDLYKQPLMASQAGIDYTFDTFDYPAKKGNTLSFNINGLGRLYLYPANFLYKGVGEVP